MRTRILYEIIQIGNLIASPRFQWTYLDGDMAKVTAIYAWWYRPVIAFGFWLAGSYPE
jgi:hypothetical protein